MSGEITLSFRGSLHRSAWRVHFEDGVWFCEPALRLWCTGCKQLKGTCKQHPHNKPLPYHNLKTGKTFTFRPRIILKREPTREEWRSFKFVTDIRTSKLYVKGNISKVME